MKVNEFITLNIFTEKLPSRYRGAFKKFMIKSSNKGEIINTLEQWKILFSDWLMNQYDPH